jgi:cathepsin C
MGTVMTEVGSKLGRKTRCQRRKTLQSRHDIAEAEASPSSRWEALSQTDHESLIAYWDVPAESIPTSVLPGAWDWGDIDGVNYISPPREQGECGSCYAIATVEMIEARLRILTDMQFDEMLSPKYILSCGLYTEGCGGGYPTLVMKFIEEFGLVPESCFPYSTQDKSCSEVCDLDSLEYSISVSSYGTVGGFYGGSSEDLIMKELRARGPLTISFNPSTDFSYYSSGIYTCKSLRTSDEEISSYSMYDCDVSLETVTHSTLLVGWGEEAGKKFWKVLNSWGSQFGEDGFFRIERGSDECAIESMAEAATPILTFK